MLSNARLLIVEDVFLIALDIQRVIEDANALQTVFARNFGEAAALRDQFHSFDLAIINPPLPDTEEMRTAEALVAAGVAIVVCTAARLDLSGTGLAGVEMISKPFADEVLLAACRQALLKASARSSGL